MIPIEVSTLKKCYGDLKAVDGISFTVNTGEVFGLLGPNGAGKTTTIKMLITLLAPTSGDATINGHSVIYHPAEVRKVIGYVPQMISVDGALTVQENRRHTSRIHFF